MNFLHVLNLLGRLMFVLALCMALTTLAEVFAFSHGAKREIMSIYALLFGFAITATFGGICWFIGRNANVELLNRRDALLLVAMSWLVGAALSAIPFFAWAKLGSAIPIADSPPHPFHNFFACYFEAMSGLTTTGASVLSSFPNDIESLPKGLLLWRAFTHWLGGLGIVVLFVAVLPVVGMGGKKLFQVEAAGPKTQGVRPRIKETARVLWIIYLGLTIALGLAYHLAGMNWFDSLCHTFATLATGGFSTQNASLGAYYENPAIDWITILFMLLAGVNFGIYYHIARRKFSNVLRDPEFRLYLILITAATLIISACIFGTTIVDTTGTDHKAGVFTSLRASAFQVISVMTTTGYGTFDYDKWSFAPKAILLALMFVGGCAGSTGGGIKVIRILICFKVVASEFERVFRPNVVKPVRVGKTVSDPDMNRSVLIYVLIILALFALGTIALKLCEPHGSLDFTTAATASVATLMNIGPGLHAVGPTANYGFFSTPSLVVMSLLMALGRLEVFALAVLVMPRFWTDR